MRDHSQDIEADLRAIGPIWNLAGPLSFQPVGGGTNNSVQLVETSAGNYYVVRLYRNHADPARLRFEHAVLIALASLGLPFAVPVPIPTSAGELFASLQTSQGEVAVTLTARIAGQPPASSNLEQAQAAGEVLGALDAALRRISGRLSDAGTSWRSYGDLEHCHPLVPDPYRGIDELPLISQSKQRLLEGYRQLGRRIPSLYASLPQQLSHEDYAPSNILMLGQHVTGVLDFEFCSTDLRAMDLTVALSWWPGRLFGTGDEWPILHAFASGYGRSARLVAEEIAAIPALYRLRAYTSLIHRLGRYYQGLSPLGAVTERAYAALEREDWLARNEAQLLQLLQGEVLSPE